MGSNLAIERLSFPFSYTCCNLESDRNSYPSVKDNTSGDNYGMKNCNCE